MNTAHIAQLIHDSHIQGVYVNRNNDSTLTIGNQEKVDTVRKLNRIQRTLLINGYRANWRGMVLVVKV